MTWPRHLSVRARSALAAMGAVTIALVLASLALLVVLHDSVERSAVATATTRAHDLAAEIGADGTTSDGAPVDGIELAPGPGDTVHVQVLAGGEVVGSSPAVAGLPPLTGATPVAGRAVEVPADVVGPGEGPFVTVLLGVEGAAGADAVVVQQSYAEGAETVLDAAQALLVAVPALVVVVGAMTYVLTGRALRPVEQIRRRSAQIGDTDLGTRIEVPATGDEIARLAVTLNGMLDRLHAAHQAQVRFVADASHELRSPLATVRAELDVALRHPETADWLRTAGAVERSNERMQQLVDDLLVLTRSAEGGAPERDHDVDLDDVVERVGFALRPPPGVRVEVVSQPARVRGNPLELERVVQNLADNAVRHAARHVRLSVAATRDAVEVRVDDDGAGVPEESRELVFERFARLDEGRARAAGGSGLGLAIVRGLVVSHGGTVRIGTSDLGGASFVVQLPTPTT
ncbi:two-component sensor histidine kinase [Cellulomonas chitinilytica]|uniref:histidine kinase n=1 Tax=Cellulomonas chitinilytica TaxID=398759 RepID=A0A919NZX6_9CELL|nr:HAMP domain-containing sensor histidine kinase [Cellulomonas chitinilytica]GIG20786.1 two-component sensor histidine kinase [Cellulomonas chitinilytica]